MLVNTYQKSKIKKRRAKRNPKPTAEQLCRVCNKPYSETHETMYGPHRQKAIKYGLQVYLCAEHHRGATGPHKDREFDLQLKRESQMHFEQTHTRDEFIRIFGRNYLD